MEVAEGRRKQHETNPEHYSGLGWSLPWGAHSVLCSTDFPTGQLFQGMPFLSSRATVRQLQKEGN